MGGFLCCALLVRCMSYLQVDASRWPERLHWQLAILGYEPAQLERLCRVGFEDVAHPSGRLRAALCQMPSGRYFALVKNCGQKEKGTLVWADVDAQDARAELDDILGALRIRHDSLLWTNLYVKV